MEAGELGVAGKVMKTLLLRQLGVLLTLPATLLAVPCDASVTRPGSFTAAVLDDVSWITYWLGERLGETVSRAAARQSVILLQGRDHAGYCSTGLNRCVLFERPSDTHILHVEGSSGFDATKASGVWLVTKTGGKVRATSNGRPENTAMSAAGKLIRDPLSGESVSSEPTSRERIEMKPCVLRQSMLPSSVPTAIRKRIRLSGADEMLRTIKSQGLLRRYPKIVVPYFADTDEVVFLRLDKLDGGSEVLAVVRRGEQWLQFCPVERVGMRRPLAQILALISQASMVTVTRDQGDLWAP